MLMKNEIFDLGMIFTLQKIIIILCVNYCMLHVKQPDMCLVSGLKQNPSQACPRTPLEARVFGANNYSLFSIT